MIIPAAYQVSNIFGTNIGGISESTVRFSHNSIYDSWLTLGITNGNIDNELGTIGIDFDNWDINNGLIINNGAIFLMNAKEVISTNEIIIGQLTLPNHISTDVSLNVQGKFNIFDTTWIQNNVIFNT